jgi:hypothetical protein
MREIKFRGLRKHPQKSTDKSYWIYGYYNFEPKSDIAEIIYNDGGITVHNDTVGQFTGWKDCKITKEYPEGQPIYEGDILRDKNGTISYVVWEDGGFAVKSPGSDAVDWDHGSWYSEKEAIGNIHENPELLK